MKSLKQYLITEALFSPSNLCKIFGVTTPTRQLANFGDDFVNKFLSKIKKRYSISNKTDVGYLWNIFREYMSPFYNSEALKKYHCSSSMELAAIIGDNIDLMNKAIGKDYFTSKYEKIRRELEEYKTSDEYVQLQPYDKDAEYPDDEENGRAFVIYYAYDPGDLDSVMVYYVNGKTTNPNTKHIMNLHKADWNYETKLGYYHANTCLVDFYRNSGKEELRTQYIDDFDE